MRVVVLHSDVGADAPPDDLDTLAVAECIARTLRENGHDAELAPFALARLQRLLAEADVVFNLVESVLGTDSLAAAAPALLEARGVFYTGSAAAPVQLAGDKPLAKRVLRAANLPTPDWAEPPVWRGLDGTRSYIVKSATEDASLGLDDGALVRGRDAVVARAEACTERFGGRWFAEAFVEGREFNVALLEVAGTWCVLPIAEMRFEDWPRAKPKIVGYRAKWDDTSEESVKTTRAFGLEKQSPQLAATLRRLSLEACNLFAMRGYARVDFRVDAEGRPTILEINPNPCLDPKAGFAAACAAADLSYETAIEYILKAALRR
jgi:D-alanine-D-alanine ligase